MNGCFFLLLVLTAGCLPGNAFGEEPDFSKKSSLTDVSPGTLPADSAGLFSAENSSSTGHSASAEIRQMPPLEAPRKEKSAGIQWKALFGEMALFTSMEHGLRMTEEKTRDQLSGPFFRDWKESVQELHGWNDQNKPFTNYVAHPMEGATAGFIYKNNDNRYHAMIFDSRDANYWKMVAKAFAISTLYSIQFELGPYSEASLGNVGQPTSEGYSKMAYIDLVITPTLGIAWMVGEDALDKHLIRRLESKPIPQGLLLTARMALNPVRTFANILRIKAPHYRDDRR